MTSGRNTLEDGRGGAANADSFGFAFSSTGFCTFDDTTGLGTASAEASGVGGILCGSGFYGHVQVAY